MKEKSTTTSRRSFIKGTALTAAGLMIVPRHVLGGPGYVAPSDKVNIALIGAGGRGKRTADPASRRARKRAGPVGPGQLQCRVGSQRGGRGLCAATYGTGTGQSQLSAAVPAALCSLKEAISSLKTTEKNLKEIIY